MANRPTEAEILAQIPAARAGERAEREAGLRATAARYDRKTSRFVLELTNGYVLGVPVSTLPALRDATNTQLAAVELNATGSSIRIPALDADYSVPGLVLSLTAREVGRRGGQVRSEAKSLAAKINGAKGGRPRKRLAALGGSDPDLRPIPRRRSG
jgi:hypothetical protein